MTIRTLVLMPGLLALGLAPLTAHADGADKAANACIQAFVDNYLPKNRPVQVRNLLPAAGAVGNYTRRYTIELTARLTHTGTELVTARCTASTSGKIIDIDAVVSDASIASATPQK